MARLTPIVFSLQGAVLYVQLAYFASNMAELDKNVGKLVGLGSANGVVDCYFNDEGNDV